MANEFAPMGRDLTDILFSIRQSLDRRLDAQHPRDFDELQTVSMRLEGLRYIVNQLRNSSRRAPLQGDVVSIFIDRLIQEASGLNESLEFQKHLAGRRYRGLPTSNTRKRHPLMHDLHEDRAPTIADALSIFIRIALTQNEPDLVDQMLSRAERPASRLRNVLPDQKVAPVQFEVVDGTLRIAHQDAKSRSRDRQNISSARNVIVERGQALLESLAITNCDRRLLETVEALQMKLVEQNDIIQLGIMNIGCETVFEQFSNELPVAVVGMLRAHSRNISLYVAQFPQWAQFAENAAIVELTEADVRTTSITANKIAAELLHAEQAVDGEVPRTIKMLASIVSDPIKASKRAVYALIRTIENLVAKIFDYGSNFLDSAISQSLDKSAKAISNVVVISLLTLAVESATGLSSVAVKLSDAAWMSKAAEIVKDQLSSRKVPD